MLEKAEVARDLLRDRIDRCGYSHSQIRSVTGIASRTLHLWYERIPRRVSPKTIDQIMRLETERPKTNSNRRPCFDREKISRAVDTFRRAREFGMKTADIVMVSGLNQGTLWKIERKDRHTRLSLSVLEGASRLERHLNKEQERVARRRRKIRDLIGG
jgi:hypothetical protein